MPVLPGPFQRRAIEPIPHFLSAEPGTAPAATHPLIEELDEVCKETLAGLLRAALAGAGRHFTARAEKTEDPAQRRELLDALHVLRLNAGGLQRAFAVEWERAEAQADEAADGVRASVTPNCQALWRGLCGQLEQLSSKLALPAAQARFAPGRVAAVLQQLVLRTELPQPTQAPALELLQQGVLTHLDQVYRRLLERLELHSLPGAAPLFPAAANQGTAATTSPGATLHVDPHTKALLVEVAQGAAGQNSGGARAYSNGELAAELLDCIKAESSRENMPVRARAVIQRLALVGRLFGSIAADPHLPPQFKQGIDRLRFPLIKSALADSSFFSQRTHPLRTLTAELMRKAAGLQLAGRKSDAELSALIESCAGHFDLAAGFVRPALAGLRPLPAPQIEKFLAEIHDEVQARAQWVAEQARRAEALELPADEPASVEAPAASRSEPVARSAAKAEAAAAELPPLLGKLEQVLGSARWFRVFDHRQQKLRWLRLEAYYPARNSIAFAEFDGANPLCMEALQFVEDLKRGRSAPTNPDERARRLLAELQRAAA